MYIDDFTDYICGEHYKGYSKALNVHDGICILLMQPSTYYDNVGRIKKSESHLLMHLCCGILHTAYVCQTVRGIHNDTICCSTGAVIAQTDAEGCSSWRRTSRASCDPHVEVVWRHG